MNFADCLRKARDTAASAFHLFLLDYSKCQGQVYAFFEGRDDTSFYINFLRELSIPSEVPRIYRCGSKDGVYETHRKVTQRARQGIVALFFVDKDLADVLEQDYPKADNIYVTDYYSVESYVVTETMLRRVWEDFFYFRDARIDFEVVAQKFREEIDKFYNIMRPIMAWIVLVCKNGLSPNLANIDLAKVCFIDEDCTVFMVNDFELAKRLETWCGVTTPEDYEAVLQSVTSQLLELEPKAYVRGKYELWFFIKFIDKLARLLNEDVLGKDERLKTRTSIGRSNAMEILGPRAEIPPSLESFLRRNFART